MTAIDRTFFDAFGMEHVVPEETIRALTEAMGEPAGDGPRFVHLGEEADLGPGVVELETGETFEVTGRIPPDVPAGYHRFRGPDGETDLIVSPARCHLPALLRAWGWAAQLYATRSRHSWGMGDFADLGSLAEWAASRGAETVLVNPLLAAAPVGPRDPSPYYPATRRFLDPIYLRVEEVPGAERLGSGLERAAAAGRRLTAAPLVDRDAIWHLKSECLEAIWSSGPPPAGFERWRTAQGRPLEEFGLWCVLCETHGPDWRRWPARYSHPDGSAVARFAVEHADRVRYHQWLQWLCRLQLDAAASATILMQDMPIGFDPAGMDAWTWQDHLARDVSIGAPPDEFNTLGQDWGLPPFVPHRLRRAGYRPFVETLRAQMARGGALRIDHVMGLFRQFWIPAGEPPTRGAYVRYPHGELLDILALESTRARAVVVGEDLGTVEPGVREELAARHVLSYRLLWFEDRPPEEWPELSMASVNTHDLPTVAGLWTGADLAEQQHYDMAPNAESTQAIRRRAARLGGVDPDAPVDEVTERLHRRLAAAPSRLITATLEDAARAVRRPNIPGASRRPNWCIPLPLLLEELIEDPIANTLATTLEGAVKGERNHGIT